jgi:Tol biopolymer transport system component
VFVTNDIGTPRIGAEPTRSAQRWWRVGTVLAIIGAAILVARWPRVTSEATSTRLITVTAFPGAEGMPSLSPDGKFVVFTWTGPDFSGNADVWVKEVEGEHLQRLTTTPEWHEYLPMWSPDGRQIAFSRQNVNGNRGVFIVSPLGGPERKVADKRGGPAWTADGKSLVLTNPEISGTISLCVHDLESDSERQLTTPTTGVLDQFPKVSPDGRTVAFVRSRTMNQSAVFTINMQGGEPRQLTEWSRLIGRLDWTPDGREIFYPQQDVAGMRVYRVAVSGGTPAPIAGLPVGVNMVAVSRSPDGSALRVALGYGQPDVGLRRIDLNDPSAGNGGTIGADVPYSDSTRHDSPGRFSRDGSRVAFVSDRSGEPKIWISNREGSNPRILPGTEGLAVNVGSWSPDSKSVAFDRALGLTSDIYIAPANGGPVIRLTSGGANNVSPEWSGDGQWIYYASDASGRSEIWKIALTGKTLIQLTHGGGFEPRESSDGQRVFYLDAPLTNGLGQPGLLKQVPAVGGPESDVIRGPRPGAWDVTGAGIVFLNGEPGFSTQPDYLEVFRFDDRKVHRLGPLPFHVSRFGTLRLLMAARDGRSVILSRIDRWDRDILAADHVR